MPNEPLDSTTAVLVDQTCAQLRLYVRQHPHAADTPDGIAMWWLHGAGAPLAPMVLERALQRLAAECVLDSRALPSGRQLWFAVRGDAPG